MSRTSSGSSRSEREVNPTTSTKITDTIRRSSPAGCPLASSRSSAPQPPQYLKPKGLLAPHASQLSASLFPQEPQKLCPASFSAPQLGQGIRSAATGGPSTQAIVSSSVASTWASGRMIGLGEVLTHALHGLGDALVGRRQRDAEEALARGPVHRARRDHDRRLL